MTMIAEWPKRSHREALRVRFSIVMFVVGFLAIYAFWIWMIWKLWTIIVRYMAEVP